MAAEEKSAARDALVKAEANMVGMVDRAQDARLSPSMTDMRTVLNDYHAAQDRMKSASYAGALVNGAAALPARAGAKRSSGLVQRRFTGEGNHAAPAIRGGGASATMTHVDGDALGTFPANFSKKPNVFVLGFVVSPRLSLTPHPRSLRARFSPTFAHSAATRDVRDRAERARVLVKRANDRVANMATGYASTPVHSTATRVVYDRASAMFQSGILDGGLNLHDWFGSTDIARRAWLMLHFMCSLITPLVPVEGVKIWSPKQVEEYTARQVTYLGLDRVGCVNKAPFASCGAVSSGIAFVHTHALPSDHFMVEKEEELEPLLLTTEVMVDEDGNSVETAKMTHRLHEHITNQTALKPIQVNVFDFAESTKDEFKAFTGQAKYRAHPAASQIVADAGGHEGIKELLRNPLVGDVVFVGGAAREEFDVILKEMAELKTILFGQATALLAFEKLGMDAFSWSKPETMMFGVMYSETTKVWRNFICAHGYGTLNGYTPSGMGEPGMSNNMRVLVRIGDWLRYMHMLPVSENFHETSIWARHFEEMCKLASDEETRIGVCLDTGVPYISRPLQMSKKGGKKSAKKQRETPASGKYHGTLMDNSKMCNNQLQQSGKELAEKLRETPATDPRFDNRLHEATSKAGKKGRTNDFVLVLVSRLTKRKEIEEIAFLSGSLKETHGGDPSSATVTIQGNRGENAISYPEMCAKFNKEKNKKKFKQAVKFPATKLTLASKPGTSLKDVMSSLETCSSDKPVGFFRRSVGGKGRFLQPNEVAEWEFDVVAYKPADESGDDEA